MEDLVRGFRIIPRRYGHNTRKTLDKFNDVVEKLNDYFQPKKNVTFERYVFKQAKRIKGENIIDYITCLRILAETCEFNNDNEEIRDQFVTSCYSKSF